jgi:hypothetical protein
MTTAVAAKSFFLIPAPFRHFPEQPFGYSNDDDNAAEGKSINAHTV